MAEYIERETLLRALSKEVEYDDDGEQEINSDTVFITIEGFPAADVAQVVRCGKCINRFNWNNGCGVCRMIGQNMNDDDFCSCGERKDGAEWPTP